MTRIPLRRRDGSVRAYALVDDGDFERLGGRPWTLMGEGYAHHGRDYLHRVVMGLERGDPRQVDHKNLDRLDCRRENLRIVPSVAQAQNTGSHGGRSRFRGVCWHKVGGKWQAYCQVDGRKRYVGLFADELAAARAVEAVRAEHMPYANPDPELLAAAGSDGYHS